MRPKGVVDAGVADHRQELLQAARPRGSAVRFRGPAGDHGHHHAAPPDGRAGHRSPGALADRGADHQQPRRNSVAHPGTFCPTVAVSLLRLCSNTFFFFAMIVF